MRHLKCKLRCDLTDMLLVNGQTKKPTEQVNNSGNKFKMVIQGNKVA